MSHLHAAFEAQPMILDRGFSMAVVTIDPCFHVPELWRHRLAFDCLFQLPELHVHVDEAPTANWTAITRFHILMVTIMMDAVPTSHEDDRLRRGKHVFSTYWAVAVR